MSHFTKLDRANITNADAFLAACKELGFSGEVRKNTQITDYSGKKMAADIAVKTGRYDLALVKRIGTANRFDMVADWWGIRRELPEASRNLGIQSDEQLQDALLRTTTKHAIIAQYRRQGFVARVKEDEQHNIHVSLTRGS